MKIRVGYEIVYNCPQPTPMILALHIHYSRSSDLVKADKLTTNRAVSISYHNDIYGNRLSRIFAPAGEIALSSDTVINDTGDLDIINISARQTPVEELPGNTLLYLLGSRYCETDLFTNLAWDLFGQSQPGWSRVKDICDFVHQHITFNYSKARPTKTAWEVLHEKTGVCRDYAHLAITFCRSMNIPARYCMGYLSDIGLPPPYAPMDFAAWIEVYLDGQWYIFDPRNNKRHIGRIVIAKGRDASDVSLSHSFGVSELTSFNVWTDEVL
jgi:transglutaminase-like putative cysteine protease